MPTYATSRAAENNSEEIIESALSSLWKLSGFTENLIAAMGEKGLPQNSLDKTNLDTLKKRLDAEPGEVDTLLREYGPWIAPLTKRNPKLGGLIEQYQKLPQEIKMLWQHLSNPSLVRAELHHIFLELEKNLGREQSKPFTDKLRLLERRIEEGEELSLCLRDVQRWNLLVERSQEINKRIEAYRKGTTGKMQESGLSGLDSYQDEKLFAMLKQSPSLGALTQWVDAYVKWDVQKTRLGFFKENIVKKDFQEGKWASGKGSEAFVRNIDNNAKIIQERFGNVFLANALRSSKGIGGRSELMVQFLQNQMMIIEGEQVKMKETESRMLLSVQQELMWIFGRRMSGLREEEEKILQEISNAYYGTFIKFPKDGLFAQIDAALSELWDERRSILKKRIELRKTLNKKFMQTIAAMANEMGIDAALKAHLGAVSNEGRAMRDGALTIPQVRIRGGLQSQLRLIRGAADFREADHAAMIKTASKEKITQNAMMLRKNMIEGEKRKYILDAAKECAAIYRWLGSLLMLNEGQKTAKDEAERMLAQLKNVEMKESAQIQNAEPLRKAA